MYKSILNFKDTQIAIKEVKDYFQKELAKALNLMRVTAPLMVTPESGLNDRLNGTERPVQFDLLETGAEVQIVQSLAKWKRFALGKYGFEPGEGIYTDMNIKVSKSFPEFSFHSVNGVIYGFFILGQLFCDIPVTLPL